jgi:hypothetical protein
MRELGSGFRLLWGVRSSQEADAATGFAPWPGRGTWPRLQSFSRRLDVWCSWTKVGRRRRLVDPRFETGGLFNQNSRKLRISSRAGELKKSCRLTRQIRSTWHCEPRRSAPQQESSRIKAEIVPPQSAKKSLTGWNRTAQDQPETPPVTSARRWPLTPSRISR